MRSRREISEIQDQAQLHRELERSQRYLRLSQEKKILIGIFLCIGEGTTIMNERGKIPNKPQEINIQMSNLPFSVSCAFGYSSK